MNIEKIKKMEACHEYKGYIVYRMTNNRPFIIIQPDESVLHFNWKNEKGYDKISFAEICRLIDNDNLQKYYGTFGDGGCYLA